MLWNAAQRIVIVRTQRGMNLARRGPESGPGSAMPSIRNFIARLPRPLADTFLQRHKIFISPETMGSSDQIIADEIEVQLVDSPPGTRGALSHDMELVEQLSTPNGEIAIDDVTNDDNLSDLPS
ncbi:MAG: hypothetical protein E5Y81_00545, partial [Mesorhizobium sp.]